MDISLITWLIFSTIFAIGYHLHSHLLLVNISPKIDVISRKVRWITIPLLAHRYNLPVFKQEKHVKALYLPFK